MRVRVRFNIASATRFRKKPVVNGRRFGTVARMRTLAISDVHGCLSNLKALWNAIDPQPEDRIIFMGDYIDRGPDSKGVIDYLLALPDPLNITFLTGNHEEKFFLSRMDHTDFDHWMQAWGGPETLASYGGGMEAVPESHWEFLRTTQPYVETDSHIFVHANLEHDVPLAEQLPFTIIHKKFGIPKPHISGKIMICGHTAQKNHIPLNLGHAVCIDTDSSRDGWITCLHVETDRYWQSNADGDIRNGALAATV